MPRPLALPALLALAAAALGQEPARQRFANLNQTFHVDLPVGWRQLAPNEALQLREQPAAPPELQFAEPRSYYAIGPVEEWLAGRMPSPWLHVVEQGNEWLLGDDFAASITEQWRTAGAEAGVRYELQAIQRERLADDHEVITAERTATPEAGRATRSLDVYAPVGGQQLTLSFTCWAEDFARWQPEFRRWLGSLTFARAARGTPQLSDRLWTPLIAGAVVGLVLVLLRRHLRPRH